MEVILKLVVWLAIWFLVWLTYYFLSNKKMNYVKQYPLTAGFFFLVSFALVTVFSKDLYFLIKPGFQILPFLFLILLFIFNAVAYRYIGSVFPQYKKAFELDGTLYFAKFDNKYLFSKSFEILYQQIMIALLVIWLISSGFSFIIAVLIFAIFFGLGHVLLFFYYKKSVSLFFLVASIISSFVFPFLILKVEWGIIYSYIFHWIFYIFAGFIFIRSTGNKKFV
jgi:hypothetical protein